MTVRTTILDGRTAEGVHVVATEGDSPYDVEFVIDGEPAPQTRRTRLYRDGGTRVFFTDRGEIRFPHRFGDDDRTPRLDGRPIT